MAGEILANRKAILKIAALSLDNERRINQLEDAVGDLVAEGLPQCQAAMFARDLARRRGLIP